MVIAMVIVMVLLKLEFLKIDFTVEFTPPTQAQASLHEVLGTIPLNGDVCRGTCIM